MTPLIRFHAHVYFDVAQQAQAADLREEVGRCFSLPVGRLHEKPIGPHSKGTFQVPFAREDFGEIVPWLMQHRYGLDVLVHGDTGNDFVDHTQHVFWLGTPQRLYVDIFRPAGEGGDSGGGAAG